MFYITERLKMTKIFVTLFLLGVFAGILGDKRSNICKRLPNHTTNNRTAGDNGYSILIKGLPYSGIYVPGKTYTVEIKNTDRDKTDGILGFMMVAVPEGDKEETKTAGKFLVPTHFVGEAEGCGNTVLTHHILYPKDEVSVEWTAPSEGGCVIFRATVISEDAKLWYKDDGGLTAKICDEDPAVINEQGDVPARDTPECCACGEARYKMVFEGLWSRQTHPKHFPTGKDALILHWSNIVGASHTEDYHIWEYGGYAERGVREVCEYGYSTKLEKDMKTNSDKIYTVIKTSPMWRNVQGRREAVFKVNQKAHLLSLLTMIGPSPDWCVGVPSLSVCNANCTWADEMVVELYPWDAGTDDGIKYVNPRKTPSDPPERIHRITHMYPKHPDSPFYGPTPVQPMARLTLTKLKEVCGTDGSSSGEEGVPSTQDLIDSMKQKMMMNKKLEMMKCATTDWTEWTECSINCGTGTQRRTRQLINENILPSMCSVSLSEEEQCQGKCMDTKPRKKGRDKLRENFEVRHTYLLDLNDPCAITPWSDWSPCNVKFCGRGVRERWRLYVRPSVQVANCKHEIMQSDICYGFFRDCRKAMMMKNFTAICSLPYNEGTCRGSFRRWYYNNNMRKCLPFNYGGCRGNDNRFETEEECRDQCAEYMEDLDVTLNTIDRAELTQVSKSDLKRMMMKKQMMEHPNSTPQLDGTDVNFSMRKKRKMMKKAKKMEKEKKRERKRKLREKRRRMKAEKMRLKKGNMTDSEGEPIDCMVTEWTPWEECSEKCGKHYITRTRMIKRQPENGGKKCPKKLIRKRKCRLPKCPRDCKVSPWSEWSTCTATCGPEAVKERKRGIMKKPRNGGMDCPSLMERQSCNLPPCNDEKAMTDFMEKMQRNPPS